MIIELGHFALILALCLALLQATLPFYGAAKNQIAFMQLAKFTARGQCLFAGIAFFSLVIGFLSNDFSVAYVAENSNTHLPIIYKFCAVWGAHEGSMLLWVFILTIWMLLVSIFNRSLPLEMLARILGVLALIAIGFYGFLLTTSDPFLRLLPNMPVDGRDLNAILQDPGLAIHPPMLYMGYVGFSVAFSFAIAALLSGRLDATWARWTRPWTLIAWCFLTYGIVLGSWWAYRELGWGGFWFWDPVENASFLPWLVGTALIHSLIVTERRNAFKAWTVFLAVAAFSLSLLGTFLVRSGVLISVHAFANDPKRGLYLLQFLLVVVGSSLALYAWRGRKLVSTVHFDFWSREMMLLTNNMILFVAMLTVLLGTLYPLIADILHLGKISVGAPYFNTVFVPLITPLLLLVGIGPYFHWHKNNPKKIFIRLSVHLVLISIAATILPIFFGVQDHVMVVIGLILAFWIIFNTLNLFFESKNKRLQWAMSFAHIGLGVTVIGLVLVTSYSVSKNLAMTVGEAATIGPYQFQLQKIQRVTSPEFNGYQASFVVNKNNQYLTTLKPEFRLFSVQEMQTSKTAIDAGIFRDLYVALGNPLSANQWSVRIYYKPFVRWIWAGGLLMIIGGLLGMRRLRFNQGISR